MEAKYYTPKAEEFHLDFEFECHIDNGLVAKSHYKEGEEWKLTKWNLYDYLWKKEISLIRVKYLDQEDIEELGWEHDYNLEPYPNRDINPVNYGYILEIDGGQVQYLLFHFDDNEVWIEKIVKCAGLGNIFKGKIKNKSELKRLMVQLGIIQEQ